LSTIQNIRMKKDFIQEMVHQNNRKRSQIRNRYLGRINQIERAAKINEKRLKKLETYEAQALQELKNTTMQHEYVQSRFRHAFGQPLTLVTNFGSHSYRSLQQLEKIEQERVKDSKLLEEEREVNKDNAESSVKKSEEEIVTKKKKNSKFSIGKNKRKENNSNGLVS